MPANTPRGFPYPLPTEPVAEGAQAIRNLAEKIDVAAVPIGVPLPWLTATIPTGYREFDGSAIVQATHPKLFALFGATMPDLRGRFLMGVSASHPLAEIGGADTHTLTEAQLASHAHPIRYNNLAHNPPAGGQGWPTINGPYADGAGSTVQAAGGNQPHNNLPPYRAIRWITAAA